MQIVFIRHSMTAGNLERRYIGCRTDEPLCEAGISLAQQKTAEIRQTFPMPEVVLTSPMRRCVQTAEILFPDTPREIVYGLQECDFGDFEGKNYAELSGDPAYQAWIDSGGTLAFPSGESRAAFCSDAVRHWNRLCSGSSIRQLPQWYTAVRSWLCFLHWKNSKSRTFRGRQDTVNRSSVL